MRARRSNSAPNLAAGHAALAFSMENGPVQRAELERAVQLDPNDQEAVNWLGNSFNAEGRKKEALAAYSRAVEIEPLFWPAVGNTLLALHSVGDDAGIQALIEREKRLGGRPSGHRHQHGVGRPEREPCGGR
jgi:Flp pilus assembly protein TadD